MKYHLRPDVQNLVISRPRTGTTWLQALLGHYLVHVYHLDAQYLMKSQPLTRTSGLPVLAFSHDPQRLLDGEPTPEQEYQGKRIVLLSRDPRDCILSAYLVVKYRHKLNEGRWNI